MTLNEVKQVANGESDELSDKFEERIHWVKQDAIDEHQERVYQHQQDCSHEHLVRDDSAHYDDPTAIGYCEDCGAELDEKMNVVGGRTM